MPRFQPSTESALGAIALGLRDRLRGSAERALDPDEGLAGKRVLITGASSGLGLAIAKRLAGRGAELVLACRSGLSSTRDAVGTRATVRHVDLADLRSIERLLERLEGPFDRVVLNAGVVPREARRTPQGFEQMFAVNYLANPVLVAGLLERSLLIPDVSAPPRVVAVSSESHRSVQPRSPSELGRFVDYSLTGSMKEYSQSKLLLSAWIGAMARRHRQGDRPTIAFHHTCPGAVDTAIAREAPRVVRPLLGPMMRAFFRSPDEAAAGVEYLCCARALEGRSGIYLHVSAEKEPAPAVTDAAYGDALLAATEHLLERGAPKGEER